MCRVVFVILVHEARRKFSKQVAWPQEMDLDSWFRVRFPLVGSSVGSYVVQHMYHLRPETTMAVILSGTGWSEAKSYIPHHFDAFRKRGLEYRYDYALETFSEEFRRTPIAKWFARMFCERNDSADLETIIMMFEAQKSEPDWLQRELKAPVLILSGSEDKSHEAAFILRDRLPDAEIVTMQGAGHACHIEQPWVFDGEVTSFLSRRGHAELPG